MLQGTCLGNALQLWDRDIDPEIEDDHGDEFSGPDGNGEDGSDLDLEHDDNEDDGSPSSVNGPPTFSKVTLAHKRGT